MMSNPMSQDARNQIFPEWPQGRVSDQLHRYRGICRQALRDRLESAGQFQTDQVTVLDAGVSADVLTAVVRDVAWMAAAYLERGWLPRSEERGETMRVGFAADSPEEKVAQALDRAWEQSPIRRQANLPTKF